MSPRDQGTDQGEVTSEQIDGLMLAVQALAGIAAESLTEVEDRVTLPQLRALMLIASRGTLNLNALAQEMSIHPSNASRTCDRLVASGLLLRSESSVDRRNLVLDLTDEGRALIDSLVEHRRAAIASVLQRVPQGRRRGVVSAMRTFGQAAGERSVGAALGLGWHH